MSSSLATQLAGIKANNNATIMDKSKRKKLHSVSLVYDPKEAASQDFETIYNDCLEAYRELTTVDSRFLNFEKSLFSETSIRFDRQIQTAEQNDALNTAIEHFLMLISGYLHLSPSLRVLEWLVRRFQIQVHNVETLFMATIPWHDSNEFVRLMDIVYHQNIPANFRFLLNAKNTMKGPSRSSLVRVCSRDPEFLNAVNAFQLKVMKANLSFDRQLVFWSSINSLIIMVYKEEGELEGAADAVLPVISEVIPLEVNPQAQIASYLVFSFVCSQLRLDGKVLRAARDTIIRTWSQESQFRGLLLVAEIHECVLNQDIKDVDMSLDRQTYELLVSSFGSVSELASKLVNFAEKNHHINEFVSCFLVALLQFDLPAIADLENVFFSKFQLSSTAINKICELVLENSPFEGEVNTALVSLVESFSSELSVSRIDRIELALETHLTNGVRDVPEDADANSLDVAVDTVAPAESQGVSHDELLETASNMEQSSLKSFFITPLPQSDSRAQLWSRAAGSGMSLENLRKMSRVSPEAELSYYFAISVGPWPTLSRIASLKVINALCLALISTKSGGKSSSIDLQACLPALLFLSSDSEKRIRSEAGKILKVIAESKPSSKTPKWEGNLNLSWLPKSDMVHIVNKLAETVEECEMDPTYIFTATRQAGKAAWCEFLCSYTVICQIPPVVWVCAKALSSFKGVTKLITPLLSIWNKKDVRSKWETLCMESRFPLSGVEKALVSAVKSNDATGIEFLLEIMRTRQNSVASFVGEHITSLWKDTFRFDTRVKVASALVNMSLNEDVEYDSSEVLYNLDPLETDLFTLLLSEATSRSVSGEPLFNETTKRRRRRSSSSVQVRPGGSEITEAAQEHLRKTTVILELLEKRASQLTNTGKLVSVLFDVLEELMALDSDSNLPILYTEEILANCLITLVEGLKKQSKLTRDLGSVKVGAVVSCIRTSRSPQVQNRLLLLIASLAGLCPDAVLHGVMPIFTFMGANTVRLDNDYSAHVIEHTIKQVIPALVAAGDREEEIETALLSFVAAFPHIPRHRRNKLFGALVSVLDPEQCLYKLFLLLSQRYTEALDARKTADARSLVQFAAPFLRGFSGSLQLRTMCNFGLFVAGANSQGGGNSQVTAGKSTVTSTGTSGSGDLRFGLLKIRSSLAESRRLRNLFFEFLARTVVDPSVIAGTQPLRVHLAAADESTDLQLSDWNALAELMDALLAHREEEPAANNVLERILEALPISRFVIPIISLLQRSKNDDDEAELERVLSLIGRKFDFESVDNENAITAARSVMSELIDLHKQRPLSSIIETAEQIAAHFGVALKDVDLELLDLLCDDRGLLSNDEDTVIAAILAASTICQQLGAVTFRFFPRIFPALCDKVRQAQAQSQTQAQTQAQVGAKDDAKDDNMSDDNADVSDEEDDDKGALELAAFAFFAGLLRQMPKFLAPETQVMLELVLSSHISVTPRMRFMSVLQEKTPPSILLPALLKSWQPATRGGISSIELFFDLLDKTIATAPRSDLAQDASNLTQLLISSLCIREQSTDQNFINQVESKSIQTVISAVLRLNDRVFRPQFVKVVQWGFKEQVPARQISALKFVLRVVQQLKSVVTSYFGHILDEVCLIIGGDASVDPQARKLALQAIECSFSTDREDFWQTPDRFQPVLSSLLNHLYLPVVTHGTLVVKAITSLASGSSQQHRKAINEGVSSLLQSSSTTSEKIWGVKVLSSLYKHLGEEWVANLPQLVPLIAELLDDEDESVELETRKSLVPVIENVLGESLDRYLA